MLCCCDDGDNDGVVLVERYVKDVVSDRYVLVAIVIPNQNKIKLE